MKKLVPSRSVDSFRCQGATDIPCTEDSSRYQLAEKQGPFGQGTIYSPATLCLLSVSVYQLRLCCCAFWNLSCCLPETFVDTYFKLYIFWMQSREDLVRTDCDRKMPDGLHIPVADLNFFATASCLCLWCANCFYYDCWDQWGNFKVTHFLMVLSRRWKLTDEYTVHYSMLCKVYVLRYNTCGKLGSTGVEILLRLTFATPIVTVRRLDWISRRKRIYNW